jgi:hypothetical protein
MQAKNDAYIAMIAILTNESYQMYYQKKEILICYIPFVYLIVNADFR